MIRNDILKNDIISIVGAGGKTSLMFYLANRLHGKKILTTSTKIMKPENYTIKIDEYINFSSDNQIIITAKKVLDSGKKLAYINEKCFISNYDYILIEADGSKMLNLKGWNETEPVIIKQSNKTIGVIDIKTIGLPVNVQNIFRLSELQKITDLNKNIDINNLSDIIKNKNGLFKNTIGKRLLFINKVESQNDFENSKKLIKLASPYVDKVFIGNTKKDWIING